MTIRTFARLSAAGILMSAALVTAASAASVRVTISNEQGVDGVFLTPLFTAFHDGYFDPFDAGSAASDAVELLAEQGDPGAVLGEAAAAGAAADVIFGFEGFAGAPVLDPGETAKVKIDVDRNQRFLSFLSMVIPSNDIFIGNDNPMAYEVFDIAGAFTDIGPISVYANDAWDAGTELNNGSGAPFNKAGGVATDVNGVITAASDSLFFLNGQETVAGTTIGLASGNSLLATIEVSQVPLPAGFPLLLAGLGAFGFLRQRAAKIAA